MPWGRIAMRTERDINNAVQKQESRPLDVLPGIEA
jgi:hypothetical protein